MTSATIIVIYERSNNFWVVDPLGNDGITIWEDIGCGKMANFKIYYGKIKW